MSAPESEERLTALSWSLRRHYLRDPVQRYRAPGMPLHKVSLCTGGTVYTPEELAKFSFAESALAKDHPMCKLCVRVAAKEERS